MVLARFESVFAMPSALNQARGDAQPDSAATPVKLFKPARTPGHRREEQNHFHVMTNQSPY
jgi:hypothetical protein